MAGGFDVTPSELHQAGATLRGVRSELSVGDGLGAGSVGDVGYADLAQALSDFCATAGDTAAGLSQAVDMAGAKTQHAGIDYERAESANAAAAAGGIRP
jgi:hypothetical protein